jgi:hypothetical protein
VQSASTTSVTERDSSQVAKTANIAMPSTATQRAADAELRLSNGASSFGS